MHLDARPLAQPAVDGTAHRGAGSFAQRAVLPLRRPWQFDHRAGEIGGDLRGLVAGIREQAGGRNLRLAEQGLLALPQPRGPVSR